MILELSIRNQILTSTYKINRNKTFEIYRGFFINPYIYQRYDTKHKGNVIQKIIRSKEIPNNHEKFTKLIHSLYLSNLMDFMLTNKQFYSNKEVLNLFYTIKPANKQEFEQFKKKRALILGLRNDVMHFNFESFEQNREIYLEALTMFEMHIGCKFSESTTLWISAGVAHCAALQ